MILTATGCTAAHAPTAGPHAASHAKRQPPVLAATLTAFNSCGDALAALRKATEASVTPYGLPGVTSWVKGNVAVASGGVAAASPAAESNTGAAGAAAAAPAASAASAAAPAVGAAPAFSGTNDYTAGVDEPDLVKTDGRRIVTVSRGTLYVIDAASRQVTGSLNLAAAGIQGDPVNLLLNGDHALLIAPYTGVVAGPPTGAAGAPSAAGTSDASAAVSPYGPRFSLIDLTGKPRLLASYGIDGNLVDARQVGSVVRVVTTSAPAIEFSPLPGETSDAGRVAAYRAVIGQAGLDTWLPAYETSGGGVTMSGRVPCTAISRPTRYSGTNLLTVLTFDLSAGTFGTGDPVSVVADGDTVYGTTSSLYVASGDMMQPMGGMAPMAPPAGVRQATQIYRFDITSPGAPRFVASGSVPGYLVDQYAMSEWNGYLRVAATTGTSWSLADGRPAGAQTSSSAVYVLTTAGPVMRTVGEVTGLGTSERIYAVRFMGPVGYVVTFRQTDPLYTLDMSDPSRPRVVGALGLTGYSAYLHPASSTRLIGIGQQADVEGHVEGTQVSLFDVSDLANPARLATFALTAWSRSAAEFDPHAFLYWPADQVVVVPIQTAGPVPVDSGATSTADVPQSGALVLRINDSGISETGFIRPPASSGFYDSSIERSLVIGQTLWTVSPTGLLASDLTTLRQQAWLPFPSAINPSYPEPGVASPPGAATLP